MDRTPPRVVAHTPAEDATSVPLDGRVEIVFSEVMDRQRTEAALFVAPEVEMRPHWSGRHLVLELDLRQGQTYVITVGSEARDLRGNGLEQSFALAFATGPHLNRGQIAGHVYRDHQPAAGAYLWAYDLAALSGPLGRALPQYRTQSGRSGEYSFSRLAAGQYRLLAFEDKDRDRKPDSEEAIALPSGDLSVTEEDTARAGDLCLVVRRRPEPRLQRVLAVDRQRVLLEFSQDVAAAAVEASLAGLPVEAAYSVEGSPRRVYLRTAPQEKGRSYAFTVLRVEGRDVADPEAVRGTDETDRTPPELVGRRPSGQQASPGDSLLLAFGENMGAAVPDSFWVASDSSAAPPGRWAQPAPAVLAFVPAVPWEPGQHRMVGRASLLRGLDGLAPRDSVVSFTFAVPAPGELVAVEGHLLPTGATGRVSARRPECQYGAQADSTGEYRLEGMLAGSYVIWGFVDRSGNGAWDAGRLEPYAPAEPYCRRATPVELLAGQTATDVRLECR